MKASALLVSVMVAAAAAVQPGSSGQWRLSDMNRGCPACTDFYQYANGGWMRSQKLPPSKARWGAYDEVDRRIDAQLSKIVAEAENAAAAGRTGTAAKIGHFFQSCMDEAAAEREGVQPIKPELARLSFLRSEPEIAAAIRTLKLRVPDLLFGAEVESDPFRPSRQMLHLSQGGLSMPDSSLYAGSGAEAAAARTQLRETAERLFELSGESRAQAAADAIRVLALETALAAATVPPEQTRDIRANIHAMSAEGANKITPHWNWRLYLQSIGAPQNAPLDLKQPRFFRGVDDALARRSPADWSAYLRWQLLYAASPWLSRPFRDARFGFDSHFYGTKAPRPRKQQCLDALNDALGPGLGQFYLQRTFTAQARRRGERIAANPKKALAERIAAASWMTAATRKRALEKLKAVRIYIGGPRDIPDYSSLVVVRAPFWADVENANVFATRDYAARLAKPTNWAQWYHLPQDYSGGADFYRNSFQYPAGKFQPPFFDPAADDALNYGSIGATMGHELSHLFDDRGRQFDAHGALHDWWTPQDAAAYAKRADRVRRAFDRITVDGEKVNGKLTVSEDIADLGGLTIAYYAMEHELAGQPRPKIDGFTPEQRFFLAWARTFRELSTPQWIRWQIHNDVHAPAKARVNGEVMNMPEFEKAFGCRPGDPMYRSPEQQARVW